MSSINKNQLFRLAAVLYADNNYEVAPKTILRKVIESALLSNGNKPVNIHQLIDFIHQNYNLHLDETEVKAIVESHREEGFLLKEKSEDTIVCLSEKRKHTIELKLQNKTIDYFIEEFEKEKATLVTGSNTKELIYRFLYEILSTNIESFKKLLDSKKKIEDLINVDSHTYTPIEREIVNEFLGWENNEKNKAIFDIASYALEYCMISNNGGNTHIQLNNLKNKIFYLDTNVVFRALGINGINRQNRTNTFLKKFAEANTVLMVSKYSEFEFKDTITFYIDKLKHNPILRKVNPAVFEEKYFKSLTDLYDFYYKWRAGKYNDSLELFEGYILGLYEKFKVDFKITADYKIPYDENEEQTAKIIDELSKSIGSFKNTEGAKHGINGDNVDASNVLLVETKRDGKNSNIFEAKQFIVSSDQSLRRWDYHRNTVTPVVILPSQWLSILLRYINRTEDDFKSFVSFLNLPSGEAQIDGEKLHIILAGISEMTENFNQQRYIVQTLVQKKFDGILEKGIKDDEILERTKAFAKSELEKQVEEIEAQKNTLQSKLETHKQITTQEIGGLKNITVEQQKIIEEKETKIGTLKFELKISKTKKQLLRWQIPAFLLAFLGLIIVAFTVLQFCCTSWVNNYPYKIIQAIDTLPSETQKSTLHNLMYAPLIGLWFISKFCWERFANTKTKREKRAEIESEFERKYK
jgi:hypothetical protein